MKKNIILSIVLNICILLCACSGKSTTTATSAGEPELSLTSAIQEDPKFHHACLTFSKEEFESKGFSLGDSCDVYFSNGYSYLDVPYHSGFYVKRGKPVVVAYPGYTTVIIATNLSNLWEEAGLKEGDTITVKLKSKGKYVNEENALSQKYSNDPSAYPTTEAFCNFRAVKGGKLKENFIYRGASPLDNSKNRAAAVDKLLEQKGIKFVLDLADSEDEINGYFAEKDFSSPFAKGLFEDNRLIPLSMSSSYASEDYRKKVVTGLCRMIKAEGPVYIHCQEGKDRTGFVCLLLSALAGADTDELREDYMLTYANYFNITKTSFPEKYTAIEGLYFRDFLEFLSNDNLFEAAVKYLTDSGMKQEDINSLIAFLTEA